VRPGHAEGLFLALLIATLIGCGLFGGASTPPLPSSATLACVAAYQQCAAQLTDANTMADYLVCRSQVDATCAIDAGGQ
jgi:hypothetical protein